MKIASHTSGVTYALDLLSEDDSLRTGGRHRSAQLEQILQNNGFVLSPLKSRPIRSRFINVLMGFRAYFEVKSFPLNIRMIRSASTVYQDFLWIIQQYPKIDGFIIEASGDLKLIVTRAARNYRKRTIVIPANIESLVNYEKEPSSIQHKVKRLSFEIDCLKEAQAIFTISTEEEWLLRLANLNSYFLPYYPPIELEERLKKIRSLREHSAKSGFLLLGSIDNVPTLQGFLELYDMVIKNNITVNKIWVAGKGTEKLANHFKDPRFVIKGTISDEDLDSLLINSTAMLICQAPTSGTLTRLIEAIYAGVPIIANPSAAKAYRFLDGVYCFYRPEDLQYAVSSSLQVPSLPSPDSIAEATLIQELLYKIAPV